MLFDVSLLFYHTGSAFAFTSGEYSSIPFFQFGTGGVGSTTTSAVIDTGAPQDYGIGSGIQPKIACLVGAGFTSACTSTLLNLALQGSTASNSGFYTIVETGTMSTASYVANTSSFNQSNFILPVDIPPRPPGQVNALPRYYRLQLTITGNTNSEGISAGSLLAGIVDSLDEGTKSFGQYPAGFSVA